MDSRKRLRVDLPCNPTNNFKTPEKRVSEVPRRDGSFKQQGVDFRHWDVETTCSYLRHEGLEEWESKFKGETTPFSDRHKKCVPNLLDFSSMSNKATVSLYRVIFRLRYLHWPLSVSSFSTVSL